LKNSEINTVNKSYAFLCLSKKGFGGLELQMANKTTEWNERGYTAIFVCYKDSPIHAYAVKQNIPCVAIHSGIDYLDPISSVQLAKTFNKFKTSVCIVGISRNLSIAFLARTFSFQTPRIVFFQQMLSGVPKRDFFHNFLYSRLHAAILPAEFMKPMLLESTATIPKTVHIIRYGISTEHYSPATTEQKKQAKAMFDVPDETVVYCMPARFDAQKDQYNCIKAFAMLNKPNAMLLLVGGTDAHSREYYLQCYNEVQQLGISNKVKFVEFCNDFRSILYATDVYILNSIIETFSLALIQAMSCGLTVIGTNSGGTPEAIQHEYNGLLVPPQNPQELYNAMELLYSNPILKTRLSKQAHLDANQLYDSNKQFEKFIAACS